jgi:hypothetical protein
MHLDQRIDRVRLGSDGIATAGKLDGLPLSLTGLGLTLEQLSLS